IGQTGHHQMEGIVLLHGPGIAPGTVLQGANIMDIAPTVLYALDLPIPAIMDGKPLTAAFTPAYLAAHPVQRFSPPLMEKGAGEGAADGREDYTAEEHDQVM
ncbi:MAG: phosphodiesterase, partial [Chloroflexota bacterium]